jgi:hypothetical protein
MPETTPTAELSAGFSAPDATARPWSEVVAVLTDAEIFWLATVRADGRPHVTPLPGVWDGGALHVSIGAHEQKARNLAGEPRCVPTTGANRLHEGMDVVVEGTARRVTDRPRLEQLAALWLSKLGWPFEVEDHGFRDGAGREGLVFAVAPDKVLAFGKGDPISQTRYRFAR